MTPDSHAAAAAAAKLLVPGYTNERTNELAAAAVGWHCEQCCIFFVYSQEELEHHTVEALNLKPACSGCRINEYAAI